MVGRGEGGVGGGLGMGGRIQIFNNCFTSLRKILWFVSHEQVNYLLKLKTEVSNNWSARQWEIRIFGITEFNNYFIFRSPSLFFHEIYIHGKRCDLPFLCKSNCKKEKGVVSFMHEQNIICSQTQLDEIAHEQSIICRRLFADHMVGSQPIKR